jgi:multidrug efflux pump subunit AcrA (membrane-fusion protein)
MRLFIRVLALLALTSAPAIAQSATTVRGTIVSVSADGAVLDVKTRAGAPATIGLKPDLKVTAIVPAELKDLSENVFVGVAAVPEGEDGLKAIEVHIFPEALRGTGEGHRAFDLGPGSTMTNGAMTARVDGVDGAKLTVSYASGSQTIRIDPATKIVKFAPGERSELKPGAEIIARGTKADDGAVQASFVLVGRGVTPPM